MEGNNKSNFGKRFWQIVNDAKKSIEEHCKDSEYICKKAYFGITYESQGMIDVVSADAYVVKFDKEYIYTIAIGEQYDWDDEFNFDELDEDDLDSCRWDEIINQSLICDLADAIINKDEILERKPLHG